MTTHAPKPHPKPDRRDRPHVEPPTAGDLSRLSDIPGPASDLEDESVPMQRYLLETTKDVGA